MHGIAIEITYYNQLIAMAISLHRFCDQHRRKLRFTREKQQKTSVLNVALAEVAEVVVLFALTGKSGMQLWQWLLVITGDCNGDE